MLTLGVIITEEGRLQGKHARVLKASGANGNSALMEVEGKVWVVHNCHCRIDNHLAH